MQIISDFLLLVKIIFNFNWIFLSTKASSNYYNLEPDPYITGILIEVIFKPISGGAIAGIIAFAVLLFSSALISGSEVAFFSLSPKEINGLKERKDRPAMAVISLLARPEKLLATILIANNFINVGIVILSSFLTAAIVDFSASVVLGLIIQIGLVTFLLLLFGEIIPKVYATHAGLSFAIKMSMPLTVISKLVSPVSGILVSSTSFVNKRLKVKQNISVEDLSHALELAKSDIKEDKEILESIVTFSNTDVTEIMKPRIDIVAAGMNFTMGKVLSMVVESNYSRIPVYEKTLDNIKGVLYIKDLLPHFEESNFNWQAIIHPPYFVPESRKINDLLKDFQKKKIHMALISDEYGGLQGLVTLEDILEEIVGEITDESDDEENFFTKIDNFTYIFEAKTQLSEFYKIISSSESTFEKIRGDADSLGGLILELKGEIPRKGELIEYKQFKFIITSADNRKIKKVKVKITEG